MENFLRAIRVNRASIPSDQVYPFSIPALKNLDRLEFNNSLTIIVGENGLGKSTLIEAVAVKLRFNPEGGSINYNYRTKETHSELHKHLVLEKGVRRPKDGFFLRAESYYTLSTEIERLGTVGPGRAEFLAQYDGLPHEKSHGEGFLSLMKTRFRGNGLYIFDEPEAALSPSRQFEILVNFKRLLSSGSQIIMATHSPILMSFPGATIIELTSDGLNEVNLESTSHYNLTRSFLLDRERFLDRLLNQ